MCLYALQKPIGIWLHVWNGNAWTDEQEKYLKGYWDKECWP